MTHENIGVCVGGVCGKGLMFQRGREQCSALPEHWKKGKCQYYLVLPVWVGRFDVILVIDMLFPLHYGSVGLVEC